MNIKKLYRRKKYEELGKQVLIVKQFRKDIQKYDCQQRLEKLREYAEFFIFNHLPYFKRRKEKYKPYGECEVCMVAKAQCQHHIIMLRNGGTNKKYNRINICEECHTSIHDWMIKSSVIKQTKLLDEEYRRVIS